ncbi:DeoR/GlpR family DNA-binding transcription regulator [Christensenella tenuis]|jgi:DeoR/GlpR family transcriptional regulator of sugar metabolism|uniref:DeoR/GlpR transcriptional regulator n=1 Tax=Christensenella tenuis TaxID=2763033 RepID=A0ABR7EJ98_9FIRM|nr:DeoR/GlpR family DNA-binding transcription regulator [Christensenella tenuis]MBC5649219.1 DeoR/GlpR transcriptional regulator [Christensenella tenuis]
MFVTERHQKIRQMILEYKRVDVSNLSRLFSVSEVTIRKDLEQLEKEGFLVRTHGGAILNEGSLPLESSISTADPDLLLKKQKIGDVLEKIISNNELIFLGAGSTCAEVSRKLVTKNELAVITNNINAIVILSENPNITLITTGGNATRKNSSIALTGSETIEFLKGKYVDKAIVSADGISYLNGFSLQNDIIAQAYTLVFNQANEKIVCATSDKFNKNAYSSFSPIDGIDTLITDASAPDDYLKYFFDHNIRVFNAYDIEDI